MSKTLPGEITHGMTGTALHRCWKNMKQRCTNPNSERFYRYGARGIIVCKDWLDFTGFMDWALNSGYKVGLTLDRIDVDGNYEPQNCRWISYEDNHNLMMQDNLSKGSGIFSDESKMKSKNSLRKILGKSVKISKEGKEFTFTSRGGAVEYLSQILSRSPASIKSQINLCLKGKCKTVGGYKVYE